MIQAALNGATTPEEHPAVPRTGAELAADAVLCGAAGAGALHIHPRDAEGRETLAPDAVNAAIAAIRAATDLPVGVTTLAQTEPDPARRAASAASYVGLDYAAVNFGEDGHEQTVAALRAVGTPMEAGLCTTDDVDRLADSGAQPLRVVIEPIEAGVDEALATAAEIHARLDHHRIAAPRLQHGFGPTTWPLLDDALARGIDTRVGLEDVQLLRDGTPAKDNAALIAEALRRPD